eukprot:CAMPEP_0202890948 /NCGR_PEP_ID=MMETSP1392-20130828/1181_1 /ASSEMBLY_ACC=CAM_ASM_000868 /TAXON_ID=225041 /ORGANISM="Chlamydomonas chlamydogama, Strain SAG 11-48b" /LENGTH=897 /DNA_ID=CAMNT_0049574603 /DNA_START=144 /DNA_END=2837 /DNA_ORIENTATION=-
MIESADLVSEDQPSRRGTEKTRVTELDALVVAYLAQRGLRGVAVEFVHELRADPQQLKLAEHVSLERLFQEWCYVYSCRFGREPVILLAQDAAERARHEGSGTASFGEHQLLYRSPLQTQSQVQLEGLHCRKSFGTARPPYEGFMDFSYSGPRCGMGDPLQQYTTVGPVIHSAEGTVAQESSPSSYNSHMSSQHDEGLDSLYDEFQQGSVARENRSSSISSQHLFRFDDQPKQPASCSTGDVINSPVNEMSRGLMPMASVKLQRFDSASPPAQEQEPSPLPSSASEEDDIPTDDQDGEPFSSLKENESWQFPACNPTLAAVREPRTPQKVLSNTTGAALEAWSELATTKLVAGTDAICQDVFIETLRREGAANMEGLFDFKRPRNTTSARKSAVLMLTPLQHDAMYALAGCADVLFLISNVTKEVRAAMTELFDISKESFTIWFKNRGRNPSKLPGIGAVGPGVTKRLVQRAARRNRGESANPVDNLPESVKTKLLNRGTRVRGVVKPAPTRQSSRARQQQLSVAAAALHTPDPVSPPDDAVADMSGRPAAASVPEAAVAKAAGSAAAPAAAAAATVPAPGGSMPVTRARPAASVPAALRQRNSQAGAQVLGSVPPAAPKLYTPSAAVPPRPAAPTQAWQQEPPPGRVRAAAPMGRPLPQPCHSTAGRPLAGGVQPRPMVPPAPQHMRMAGPLPVPSADGSLPPPGFMLASHPVMLPPVPHPAPPSTPLPRGLHPGTQFDVMGQEGFEFELEFCGTGGMSPAGQYGMEPMLPPLYHAPSPHTQMLHPVHHRHPHPPAPHPHHPGQPQYPSMMGYASVPMQGLFSMQVQGVNQAHNQGCAEPSSPGQQQQQQELRAADQVVQPRHPDLDMSEMDIAACCSMVDGEHSDLLNVLEDLDM